MKNTFIIFLIISASFTQAQDFESGLILGGAFCQIDGDASGGYKKIGPQLGGFVKIDLQGDLDVIIEMKYIQKGARNVWTGNNSSYGYYVARLNYIELPVMGTYQFGKKLYVNAGLTFGYLISAVEDKDGYGFTPAYPEFYSYEIGAIAGISYELTPKIFANVSASYSALPIRPHPGGQVYLTDRGQYNNTIQFSLIYKFFK